MSQYQKTNIEKKIVNDLEDDGNIWGKDDPFSGDLFSRRVRHFESSSNTHWSIAWSDLMMTMFILFAVMFIYQMAKRDLTFGKGPGITEISDTGSGLVIDEGMTKAIRESFPDIYDLSRETINDIASVELIEDKAVRITLTNDLLFEPGKAGLKPGALKVLDGVASVIKQTLYMVNVVGHTDNVPIHTEQFPTNWELSAVRACVVARYLIENRGVKGERVFITGHSYYQPLVSNASRRSRRENRRVEIIITKDRPEGGR